MVPFANWEVPSPKYFQVIGLEIIVLNTQMFNGSDEKEVPITLQHVFYKPYIPAFQLCHILSLLLFKQYAAVFIIKQRRKAGAMLILPLPVVDWNI